MAIALAMVGARPVKEATGRVVKYELVPLSELKRPRIDVLASLSGIFRDSFANVVDLLDDLFETAAAAEVRAHDIYARLRRMCTYLFLLVFFFFIRTCPVFSFPFCFSRCKISTAPGRKCGTLMVSPVVPRSTNCRSVAHLGAVDGRCHSH